ncbi:uncharacterized protein LOC115224693 [Octopus sinensis]|uniref:Uncharacterized protein LOC115224693 n=1 Tax=Octopus sinensis TaxID=2607531 RepID=A0A6P7TN70_9MOLL|nr:uncharacterized protein LOC115224693 [Octopus sinensis]
MRATTSITNSNLILLLFCVLCLQIITPASSCPRGQLKRGDKCCRPVLHCPAGSYVKTCERNGNCDECLPCPSGTENPFITSSFDVKKCYKNDCPTDSFRISETKCKCALHLGHTGKDPHFCQVNRGNCQPGQELTNRGKCEDCENNHYKYWFGKGYCIRDVDCTLVGLPTEAGNVTTPSICPDLEDKCSPKTRVPPLPTAVVPSTTTTRSPSVVPTVKGIRKRLSTQTPKEPKPSATIRHMTEKPKKTTTVDYVQTSGLMDRENALDLFKVQYINVTVNCVLIIIIVLQAVYIVRIKRKYNLQYFPASKLFTTNKNLPHPTHMQHCVNNSVIRYATTTHAQQKENSTTKKTHKRLDIYITNL